MTDMTTPDNVVREVPARDQAPVVGDDLHPVGPGDVEPVSPGHGEPALAGDGEPVPSRHGQPAPSGDSEPVPPGDRDPVPGAVRPMIAVSRLAAHPGNVRRDLDLSPGFVDSVGANGVLVALRITPEADGFRVIDGARRLAAALRAGVAEVPYDLVAERAGDEAGQYLDMVNANRHRKPLTVSAGCWPAAGPGCP